MTKTDAGDYTLTINGNVIRQFTGSDVTPDGESSINMAPSGEGFGFDDRASANTANGTISVRETSPDLDLLYEYVREKTDLEVQVKVTKNLGKYKIGRIIGWSGELCRLQPTNQSFATSSESQDISFGLLVIGFDHLKKESE